MSRAPSALRDPSTDGPQAAPARRGSTFHHGLWSCRFVHRFETCVQNAASPPSVGELAGRGCDDGARTEPRRPKVPQEAKNVPAPQKARSGGVVRPLRCALGTGVPEGPPASRDQALRHHAMAAATATRQSLSWVKQLRSLAHTVIPPYSQCMQFYRTSPGPLSWELQLGYMSYVFYDIFMCKILNRKCGLCDPHES